MFILIDKPKGITSHDVIERLRDITKEKKIGHAGTLDPNATGLLVIGVGKESTKKLGKISVNTKKIYEAEIYLGEEKDTDDIEGVTISKVKGFLAPSEKEIRLILASFIGKKMQIPPSFSAIKIKGKKAYEIARKGKKVKLDPREITIYSIRLLKYQYPILIIKTTVSSGTYIRSLARDIGKMIGSGGYLSNLERVGIGKFSLDKAVKLGQLNKNNWKKFAKDIK